MKISTILQAKRSLSFEVYPPKPDQTLDALNETLSHLYAQEPDFISCTYGAAGTNHDRNAEVCNMIAEAFDGPLLAHYTCIGSTRDGVCAQMEQYREMGIENVLALRGDFPNGFSGTQGDFDHADALLEFLKPRFPETCFGVACYPETHVRAASPQADLDVLLGKQAAGAEFCISQLCFDADAVLRFRDRAEKAGLRIPMVVGVLPVLNAERVRAMAESNGCRLPDGLCALMEAYVGDPAAFREVGVEFTAQLVAQLAAEGAAGLHIYSMNGYRYVEAILRRCTALR